MTRCSTILHDILNIVIKLNKGSTYDAWYDISGHVDWLSVRITPADRYEDVVFNSPGVDITSEAELTTLKHELQDWSKTNGP